MEEYPAILNCSTCRTVPQWTESWADNIYYRCLQCEARGPEVGYTTGAIKAWNRMHGPAKDREVYEFDIANNDYRDYRHLDYYQVPLLVLDELNIPYTKAAIQETLLIKGKYYYATRTGRWRNKGNNKWYHSKGILHFLQTIGV